MVSYVFINIKSRNHFKRSLLVDEIELVSTPLSTYFI